MCDLFRRGRVKILMYHGIPTRKEFDGVANYYGYNVPLNEFEQHIRYLSNRCNVISLRDLLDGENLSNSKMNIVLTFDDGYENNFSNAFKLLQKYNFSALFASLKYEPAGVILPYLAVPLTLHGAITIYTAGIYIQKKTQYVLYFTIGAGILNLILNIILVPMIGLVGAAVATLISYLFLITLSNVLSAKFLTLHLNYQALTKYDLKVT
ncbi:MAG: polysaccharide biosynthesis C-terminal domain-containing protein [Calditrichaeota bacterium]|nr:polysaccharide biosynthesis C-terminal domain-containing protein [Calditrichota bacterium]